MIIGSMYPKDPFKPLNTALIIACVSQNRKFDIGIWDIFLVQSQDKLNMILKIMYLPPDSQNMNNLMEIFIVIKFCLQTQAHYPFSIPPLKWVTHGCCMRGINGTSFLRRNITDVSSSILSTPIIFTFPTHIIFFPDIFVFRLSSTPTDFINKNKISFRPYKTHIMNFLFIVKKSTPWRSKNQRKSQGRSAPQVPT